MSSINIQVKANNNYICQECGNTELIQAHHQIPGDDNTIICLCAECHSKKHPDVPKNLFFSIIHQPYWHNKSASSLAKECGIHSRSIIRRAKKLKIKRGFLTKENESKIKNMSSWGHKQWGDVYPYKKKEDPINLIQKLKQKKEAENLTCAQLEARLNIDRFTIWRWLAGRHKPSKMAQEKLRKFLGENND